MREWMEEVERRLRGAKLDAAAEREIAEELAQHLVDRYEELCARGVSATDARAQVLVELGDDDALEQHLREVVQPRPEPLTLGRPTYRGLSSGVWSDVRFGARMLMRSPMYTAVAVLVIALGSVEAELGPGGVPRARVSGGGIAGSPRGRRMASTDSANPANSTSVNVTLKKIPRRWTRTRTSSKARPCSR